MDGSLFIGTICYYYFYNQEIMIQTKNNCIALETCASLPSIFHGTFVVRFRITQYILELSSQDHYKTEGEFLSKSEFYL